MILETVKDLDVRSAVGGAQQGAVTLRLHVVSCCHTPRSSWSTFEISRDFHGWLPGTPGGFQTTSRRVGSSRIGSGSGQNNVLSHESGRIALARPSDPTRETPWKFPGYFGVFSLHPSTDLLAHFWTCTASHAHVVDRCTAASLIAVCCLDPVGAAYRVVQMVAYLGEGRREEGVGERVVRAKGLASAHSDGCFDFSPADSVQSALGGREGYCAVSETSGVFGYAVDSTPALAAHANEY